MVLRKSLAKRAADRYANVDQMYKAIGDCLTGAIQGSRVVVKTPLSSDSRNEERTKVEAPPEEITNSLGATFRLIHPGTFMMGSLASESVRARPVGPLRRPQLSCCPEFWDLSGPRSGVESLLEAGVERGTNVDDFSEIIRCQGMSK